MSHVHQRLRIWDLPTRLFHWLLAASVIALVVTAKIGGNAMDWHLRLGHFVLALLVFRVVWGVVGGHWSRFATFIPSPAKLLRYVRGQGSPADNAGHNPLGALSVVAMLGILGLQTGTGLVSDDEIAFAGSLSRFVSYDTIGWATGWHKGWGQWLLLALLDLHIVAIVGYTVFKRERLVPAMVHGDKTLPAADASHALPASRDALAQRLLGAVVAAISGGLAWWVWTLGAPAF